MLAGFLHFHLLSIYSVIAIGMILSQKVYQLSYMLLFLYYSIILFISLEVLLSMNYYKINDNNNQTIVSYNKVEAVRESQMLKS